MQLNALLDFLGETIRRLSIPLMQMSDTYRETELERLGLYLLQKKNGMPPKQETFFCVSMRSVFSNSDASPELTKR